jgi:hypothetical protein
MYLPSLFVVNEALDTDTCYFIALELIRQATD